MAEPMAAAITQEQALAWARTAVWHFSSYYKYHFQFSGHRTRATAPDQQNWTGVAGTGGTAEDIYKFDVSDPMTWDELCEPGEPDLVILDGSIRVWPAQ